MIESLSLFEYSFCVIYLCIIFLGAFLYRSVKITDNPEYRYFIPALSAKLIGGLLFALLSVYYYRGGDTIFYYQAAEGWLEHILNNPADNVSSLFSPDAYIKHHFTHRYIFNSNDVKVMVYNTIPLVFLGLKSYLLTSVLFAFFSFWGLWKGYSNLCKIYPDATELLSIGFFFIPTAILWSSGILKDTISQGIIGLLIYSVSNIFLFKRRIFLSILIMLAGSIVIFNLKPYILYILMPCFLIWIQSSVKSLIKSPVTRFMLLPIIIVALAFSGYYITNSLSQSAGKYSLNKLEKTLEGFHSWHTHLAETQDQSGYSLGDFEYSFAGLISKIPAALNVTFFRPYFWEIRNLPTLLGAIEGFFFLFITLFLLFKLKKYFFIFIYSNKEAAFMFMFALLFGYIVGISSYNFGALSRYKIPAVMFFALGMAIVYREYLRIKRLKNR